MWLVAAEYISSKGEPQWLKKFSRPPTPVEHVQHLAPCSWLITQTLEQSYTVLEISLCADAPHSCSCNVSSVVSSANSAAVDRLEISARADLKAVDSSRVCRTDDTGNVAAARVRGISTEADLKNGVRLLKSLRD